MDDPIADLYRRLYLLSMIAERKLMPMTAAALAKLAETVVVEAQGRSEVMLGLAEVLEPSPA